MPTSPSTASSSTVDASSTSTATYRAAQTGRRPDVEVAPRPLVHRQVGFGPAWAAARRPAPRCALDGGPARRCWSKKAIISRSPSMFGPGRAFGRILVAPRTGQQTPRHAQPLDGAERVVAIAVGPTGDQHRRAAELGRTRAVGPERGSSRGATSASRSAERSQSIIHGGDCVDAAAPTRRPSPIALAPHAPAPAAARSSPPCTAGSRSGRAPAARRRSSARRRCSGRRWRTSPRSRRSSGTPSVAMCNELKPEYDVPNMPTRPVDHGCAASHSIAVRRSARSMSGYSSSRMPPDEPVPRRSSRSTANPPSVGEAAIAVGVRRGDVVLAVRQCLQQRRERTVAIGQVQRAASQHAVGRLDADRARPTVTAATSRTESCMAVQSSLGRRGPLPARVLSMSPSSGSVGSVRPPPTGWPAAASTSSVSSSSSSVTCAVPRTTTRGSSAARTTRPGTSS